MAAPQQLQLKDGSMASIFFIDDKCSEVIPLGIREQLMALYNDAIEAGQTYPYIDSVRDLEEFASAWLLHSCVVMVAGEHKELAGDQRVLGTYYVKPNYAGRCSHVCNAGFLVSAASRGKGLGKILGRSYVNYAPTLGYTYSVFNLVFATNIASWKIWDALGFERIGVIPGAARLKNIEGEVDAYIYGKKLTI